MIRLSTADASHIYDVPMSTIRRWATEGRLRRLGTRHRRLWDVDEIEQLVRPDQPTRLTRHSK